MAKLVIFGIGDIAQIAKYYFETDSEHEVVAFTVDRAYMSSPTLEGLPVVPFEEVEKFYPPRDYMMFVAVSYAQMNKLRQDKYLNAKSKGYRLASYISSFCTFRSQFKVGENAFIFEDNTIQPFVKIAENVTMWSGNHIGHHSVICPHNFISSHVVISGHCTIESNCFLGVNSTLAHQVKLAEGTLIGAGAVISKDTEAYSIYVPQRSVKLDKRSDEVKL
jgi:sugar O-acyltransferase (sialic acid O-acetyltransferase NeuD family)